MIKSYFPADRHADVKVQIFRNGTNTSAESWINMLKKFNNIDYYTLPVDKRPEINTIDSMEDGLHYRLFVNTATNIPTNAELAESTLEFALESRLSEEQRSEVLRNLPKNLLDAGILEYSEFVIFDRDMKQHFPFTRTEINENQRF